MSNNPTLSEEFKAFKDGVYDAVVNGSAAVHPNRNLRHYYDAGYDFGMTIYSDMIAEEE